jgi:hypothetical protein
VVPVTPGAEQSAFDNVATDLTAAAASGGALADPNGGLASLGTLNTNAFVAPNFETDMTAVDSSESCDGDNVVLKSPTVPSASATPSCECEDFYVGKPAWDPEAARWGLSQTDLPRGHDHKLNKT